MMALNNLKFLLLFFICVAAAKWRASGYDRKKSNENVLWRTPNTLNAMIARFSNLFTSPGLKLHSTLQWWWSDQSMQCHLSYRWTSMISLYCSIVRFLICLHMRCMITVWYNRKKSNWMHDHDTTTHCLNINAFVRANTHIRNPYTVTNAINNRARKKICSLKRI